MNDGSSLKNDNLSIGKLFDGERGPELVQGKASVIADKVTIRNRTIYYLGESLLDSGEASPSDSFFPPPCPAPQNPRDFSEEA